MHPIPAAVPLRLLAIQVTELPDGVALRRGSTLIHVKGEGLPAVFELLFEFSAAKTLTIQHFLEWFSVDTKDAIARLLLMLLEHRLLVPTDSPESALDHGPHAEVFYWNFGKSGPEVACQINAKRLLLIGVNTISWCIAG